MLTSLASAQLDLTIPESHKELLAGESILTSIKIINFENVERIDVGIEVYVENNEGEYISGSTETVAIQTQANFVRTIKLPDNLKEGEYKAKVKLTYDNGEIIEAQDRFKIIKEKNKILRTYTIILSIIIIMGIVALIKTTPLIKKYQLKMKIKHIVKKRFKK